MSKKLAVLVKQFPKLSESFIQGEIEYLIEAGYDVAVFSLRRPTELVGPNVSEDILSRVHYLEDVSFIDRAVTLLPGLLFRPVALPVMFRELPDRTALGQAAALMALCRRLGVEHIHAHYLAEPAALAHVVSQLGGPPFSISAHAKDIYVGNHRATSARVRNARFVATCTAHNHHYLRSLPIDPTKIKLVFHGIDTQRFRAAANRQRNPVPTIVAVGRLKEKKGFDVLIRACALLKSRGQSLRCCIYGYGNQEQALRALISELNVADCAAICPPVNHTELPMILASADVFALPCRVAADGDRDGIPNSLLEAMACALPVVSTAISGVPEVVADRNNGLLVESDDAVALADGLQQLLADPKWARQLGWAARRTIVQRFSWRTNIRPLVSLLEADSRVAEFGLEEVIS